jgi:hypothetical protein
MPIPFQLRFPLLLAALLSLAACGPAKKPTEPFAEPPLDPATGVDEHFQGVFKLRPWPTLILMESAEGPDLIEAPFPLVTPEWTALENNADLRKLNDKLVELHGTPVASGPARVIQVAPGTLRELEGSMGTPGRAAESQPAKLPARGWKGRVFSLGFLSRNGPKLPALDDQAAIDLQLKEVAAGLPVVLLVDKDARPPELASPLLLLTDAKGDPMSAESLRLPFNFGEATWYGEVEVQGAWQVLRVTGVPSSQAEKPAPTP